MAMAMRPVPPGDDRKVIEVPHVRQCYSWDCGLACVSMVLQHYDIPSKEVYTKDLDAQQCGESVWTIDLACIAARNAIPHRLCTITLGANAEHASKSFYSGFTRDEKRVNKLFEEAATQGVQVEQRSVALEEVVNHLSTGCLAVVLIDWRYLECMWCPPNMGRCCLWCMDIGHSGYQGHFIVVCGYNRTKQHIFYKNPNTSDSLCCCQFESFEKARKSHGTDEDILFLYKTERPSASH
ncbi:protein GUCD1-like [Littorina saxatilis]|uniref:Uncharacterized protein n=1 Tax=Littorina saxatilis TaxID=31220 RepID=A0AAN9AJW5_9CAEN